MKKSEVKIGDILTVKERVKGYYSDYAGNPATYFEPGMEGVVGAIDVPSVSVNRSFICLDYFCPKTQKTQRCASSYSNLKAIK